RRWSPGHQAEPGPSRLRSLTSVHKLVLDAEGAVGPLSPTVTGKQGAAIRDRSLTDEGVIDRSTDDAEVRESFTKVAGRGRVEPTVFRVCRGQDRCRLARTQAQGKWEPG